MKCVAILIHLLALPAAAVLLIAAPVHAADFDAPILDMNGKPTPRCLDRNDPKCAKPVTIGFVAATALLTDYPDEIDPRTRATTVSGVDKMRRALLALKVYPASGDVKLSAADTALIIALVGKAFPPLTVLRVTQTLDPASLPKD